MLKLIVVTIGNQKGGIGKTTTATALASILKEKGYKTLLIDTDMQCSSTYIFQGEYEGRTTLYDVLLDKDNPSPISEAIQNTNVGDIVAGDPLLREADVRFVSNPDGYYHLADALEEIRDIYDFVIIDTAPMLNSMLLSSLYASDYVIIPSDPSPLSILGFSQFHDTIATTQKRANPKLKIAGYLLIKYKATTNMSNVTFNQIQKFAQKIGSKIFNTKIRECVKQQEAQGKRTPIIQYSRNSTTAKDYVDFVDEFLDDLGIRKENK